MRLVNYRSRNPYQPAKSISKFDDQFLVATLSRIQTDAKSFEKKKNIFPLFILISFI